MSESSRARVLGVATVGALVVAALAALLWGSAALEGAGSTEPAADEGLSERASELAARVLEGEAVGSSKGSFLADLGVLTEPDAGGEGAVVCWYVPEGLPAAARGLLEAYRDEGGCELVTSGYLDLRGLSWGALVRSDAGWVDVAVVTADADDGEGRARVARLAPSE